MKAACINGGDYVRTPAGPKRVDQLVVGDIVATSKADSNDAIFEPIQTFLHRDPSTDAYGFRFFTSNGRNLSLSDEHLIFLAPNGHAVLAKHVRVGDSFYGSGRVETVRKVERTFLEGRYSPLTKSGTILINDILVSCYSQIEDHHLMHYVVQWLLPFLRSDGLFGSEGQLGGGDGLHAIGGALWHFFRHYFITS